MLFHEFGTENEKILVMIHGACMSWDMFQESISILAEDFHVIAVAVPGHDMETEEEFTSVEDIAKRIESGLIQRGCDFVDLLYGLSMGGGLVIRILADNRLNVKRAVIDAGITPYELPYLLTRAILVRDFLMVEWGKHSKKALSLAFPPDEYTEEGIDYMYQVMQHMTNRTIWRVFDSTDNYSMPASFPGIDTKIEYWYGSEEKKARKLDIAYVKKHIPHVVFRELPGMDHGQYVLMCPSDFARDITAGEGTERSVEYYDGKPDDNMTVSQKTAKRFLTKNKRKTKQENSIWNFYAPIYNLFMRSNRKQYERMNRRIRKIIRNRRVLEVATGTGLIAKNVADAADIMIATDFAQKMLEEAHKGFVPDNLTFQMEDATARSFEDNSFDVVIISNALHIIPNPQKALSEAARVLKPGGILIAPNFIHDNKSSKAMFWSKALTAAGIAFEAKWDENGYGKFLESQGFQVKNYAVLPAMIPLMYTECQL